MTQRRSASARPRKAVLGLHDVRLGRAIGRRLEEHGGLDLAGVASNSDDVVRLAGALRPDLVLVDEGLVTAEYGQLDRLRAASDASVIVLVKRGQARRVPLPEGANAYLAMRPVDDLVAGLLDVTTIAELARSSGAGATRA